MRIQVSPSELDARKLDDETLKAAIEALYVDGYLVLGGVVSHAVLDAMRTRLEEDTAELLRRIGRNEGSGELDGQLSQPMPRSPEYIHAAIVTNPLVIQITASILGKGVHNHFYNCNTNLPGSQAQPLHRDAAHLNHDPVNPIISIIVNVSPIEVNESNGATEIWPGTHWIEGLTRISDHAAERRRVLAPPVRMLSRKGDVVLRDPRLWHRGVPNQGTDIRHMVAMVHSRGFYESDVAIPVVREALHSFDDDVLTTRITPVDDDYDYLAESLHLQFG